MEILDAATSPRRSGSDSRYLYNGNIMERERMEKERMERENGEDG